MGTGMRTIMRTELLALAGWGLILLTAVSADGPVTKGKDKVAREIDLKGFRAERPRGYATNPTHPTKITSAEQLAKMVPDTQWQSRISKQVDFAGEQLLFFAWWGSGQDKLSFQGVKTKKEPVIDFTYSVGETDDLRPHFHLYAIASNASWRVMGQK
jgi:hypothetical protein